MLVIVFIFVGVLINKEVKWKNFEQSIVKDYEEKGLRDVTVSFNTVVYSGEKLHYYNIKCNGLGEWEPSKIYDMMKTMKGISKMYEYNNVYYHLQSIVSDNNEYELFDESLSKNDKEIYNDEKFIEVECPECGGSGLLKYNYGASDLEAVLSGHDPYTFSQCYKCLGTGKIKVPK